MHILVVGVPGTGKTTLASLLSRELQLSYLNLAAFVLEKGLWLDYDPAHRSFIIDPQRVAHALSEAVRVNPNLVVESTDVLTPWEAGLEPLLVVVLRCKPSTLAQRLALKGWPHLKILENLEAELLGVVSHQARELYPQRVCELDTSSVEPRKLLDEVLRVVEVMVRGGGPEHPPCAPQPLDWLSDEESLTLLARMDSLRAGT